MCWGVTVAATLEGADATKSTACFVVMCSRTTLRSGTRSSSGVNTVSMKTASLSNMSTLGSVTSPWTRSRSPACRPPQLWNLVIVFRLLYGRHGQLRQCIHRQQWECRTSAMVCKVGMHRLISVTPAVRVCGGAQLGTACKATTPFSFAVCTSSGVVSSVRYSVIKGLKVYAVWDCLQDAALVFHRLDSSRTWCSGLEYFLADQVLTCWTAGWL